MSSNSRFSLCVAVLAAGGSKRFGDADKLAEPLDGTMLGLHICDTLTPLSAANSIVVTSSADHACADGWRDKGFELIVNERADQGLGTSVAMAARAATRNRADAVLICLADMPFVPASHLRRLAESYDPANGCTVIASTNGDTRSPPALFGAEHLAELSELEGNSGARQLLASAHALEIVPHLLADIDTRAQLDKANTLSR